VAGTTGYTLEACSRSQLKNIEWIVLCSLFVGRVATRITFEFFETNFVVRKPGVSKNARIIQITFGV